MIRKYDVRCPECGGAFEPVTVLNMMFPVQLGVGKQSRAFLRPETAQGPYVNFKMQYELQRKKLPLGLALIGRAYRNEISPRHFTLRQREFTQAELQIFFDPDTIDEHPDFTSIEQKKLRIVLANKRKEGMREMKAGELDLPQWYVYHLAKIQEFYVDVLRIPIEKFRLYQLNDKEKAFYNKYHFDVEVHLNELGWTEVGGLHYRTDHDLKGHQRVSGESMEVMHNEKKFIPHVLELSFGVDRNVYALIDAAYDNDKKRGNIVLHLPPTLAPLPIAVFPLVKNKPALVNKAREVQKLIKRTYPCFWDEVASIGRRYARIDEVGIPLAVTVDFDTLEDNTVTLRDRETTKQVRVNIDELIEKVNAFLSGAKIETLGKLV
jgi:glycyl-tRNA synthetase